MLLIKQEHNEEDKQFDEEELEKELLLLSHVDKTSKGLILYDYEDMVGTIVPAYPSAENVTKLHQLVVDILADVEQFCDDCADKIDDDKDKHIKCGMCGDSLCDKCYQNGNGTCSCCQDDDID